MTKSLDEWIEEIDREGPFWTFVLDQIIWNLSPPLGERGMQNRSGVDFREDGGKQSNIIDPETGEGLSVFIDLNNDLCLCRFYYNSYHGKNVTLFVNRYYTHDKTECAEEIILYYTNPRTGESYYARYLFGKTKAYIAQVSNARAAAGLIDVMDLHQNIKSNRFISSKDKLKRGADGICERRLKLSNPIDPKILLKIARGNYLAYSDTINVSRPGVFRDLFPNPNQDKPQI